MKALFVATVVKTHINVFHLPFLKMFKDAGWETAVCAKNDFKNKDECVIPNCDKYMDFAFKRNPFHPANLKVFLKLKKLIDKEKYDIIHCHTPVGGVLSRLAGIKARKNKTKIIYTAHGFHFYKGAPVLNWLLYYPVEWFCSFFTDTLITINKEDFELAKRKFHTKKTVYVPGVGIDTERIAKTEVDIEKKRKEIGICENDVVVLSVGELNDNKNHETVLRAIAKLENQNVTYAICGRGENEKKLKELAKELGVEDKLKLLGYRNDVAEIMECSDIFAFPSKREGLPVSVMEAMSAGLPIVCSKIRGNTDLITDDEGGYLCNPDSIDEFKQKLELLISDKDKRIKMGKINREKVKKFDIENVKNEMKEIYGI